MAIVRQITTDNVVVYDISYDPITNDHPEILPKPPFIPRDSIILILGEAPSWRYGLALAYLRKTPAAVVAFKDYDTNCFRVVLSANPRYPDGAVLQF